jgi:hypothetical protein
LRCLRNCCGSLRRWLIFQKLAAKNGAEQSQVLLEISNRSACRQCFAVAVSMAILALNFSTLKTTSEEHRG